MGGGSSVRRPHGPYVFQHADRSAAQVHHGLHRNGHARDQSDPVPRRAVIRHLRFLVHFGAYAVTHVFPDDGVAVRLHIRLDGVGDIRHPVPGAGHFESLEKALSRDLHQPPHLLRDLPGEIGGGAVPMEAVDIGSHVDADDVSLPDLPSPGDPMDHLVVDGDTYAGGIARVMEEGRPGPLAHDEIMDRSVDGFRGYAGLHHFPCKRTGSRGNLSRSAHRIDVASGFQGDQESCSRAAASFSEVSSTLAVPSTGMSLPWSL